ncbi:endonuclease [Chryseobacterium sp.]|uniref:endonuclease n=1 Tax=Chryseobacterium sp. TaxID=1871047 RepID=UPI0011C81405|nr:endonuclease [Chryseobacterium sp.]TXF77469.1 T9SS type A sorting domain-containing protein [Chryseobacterium sp.]
MKKIFTFLLVNLLFASTFAQIPTGYYSGTTGLTGYPLKTKLSQIITAGHQDMGYGGLWIGYQTTDRDYYYENNGKVLDMYSENPTGADPYEYNITSDQCGNYSAEGACYNREHTVPQSLFNSANPMHNDIHFIPPTDGKVNGVRSNYPYGVVTTPTWTSLNGSKLGPNTTTGYSGVVFEPINAFKGDIARMIFYFVTRYQNQIPSFSSGNMLDGTTTRSLTQWELEVLLAWNDADPVSPREIDRNNAAYAFQGNRNPYIDNPNWVHEVWGFVNTTPDTVAPSTPTNLAVNNITGNSATATWTASTDNIAVAGYNVYLNGVLFGSSGSTTFNITGLNPNTLYSVTVTAFDAAGNNSPASAPVNFTTLNVVVPPGNSNELYISEYVEGTSNNRAIELTNATPDPIDLSNYSIQKQVNGAGAWGGNFPLTGTLAPNTAFVVKNFNATFTCTFTADMTATGTPLDFNGNDPVGLFKNGVLIDIVGTFNGGSADFAADTTLRRNVNNPSTTYSATQWDSFPVNTCDNLGIANPASVLATVENDLSQSWSVYPNPVKNGILYILGEDLNQVNRAEIYDMNGALIQVIDKPFRSSNKIILRNSTKGNYILKAGSYSTKFIVN